MGAEGGPVMGRVVGMPVRKRAPGGGRKPMGPYQGKGSMLTTRIMPETRAALEDGAVEKGVSLSQYVEWILCQHFGLKTGIELKYERLRAERAPVVVAGDEEVAG